MRLTARLGSSRAVDNPAQHVQRSVIKGDIRLSGRRKRDLRLGPRAGTGITAQLAAILGISQIYKAAPPTTPIIIAVPAAAPVSK